MREGELSALGTALVNADVTGAVLSGVLVLGDVVAVKVDKEECDTADQYAGRAEVVPCFLAAFLVHVACKSKVVKINPEIPVDTDTTTLITFFTNDLGQSIL